MVMVGRFAEVCRRIELKVKVGNSKVMLQNGEEGLECEVRVDGIRLRHVSEFKYLGFLTNKVLMELNVVGRWRVRGRWQLSSGPWLMLGICSLSVLESCMKHCLCLLFCMSVKR